MTRDNVAEKFSSRDDLVNDSGKDPGNPKWRDCAMNEPTALQSLSEHVASRARSHDAVRLAVRIAPPRQLGGNPPDLAELLSRRDADGRPAIRIQERLAQEAPRDQLAALALLTMLRGDLEVLRDRLVRSGRVSAADAEADALGAAWEVVTRRPPPGRWERSDAIWNQARRVSLVRRQCSLETEPLPEGFDRADDDGAERGWVSSPAPLLAAAVVAGVLSPRELVLVARTRLEGRPLSKVARELGRPYDAARMERRRAETALATFVGRYDTGGSW
jgi:hypothetical protein